MTTRQNPAPNRSGLIFSQQKRRAKAGALVIKMRLERVDGILMNHKKIRRIMRRYNLSATIRRANPYRKIVKATQQHQESSFFMTIGSGPSCKM